VGLKEPQFPVVDTGVGVANLGLAFSEALDFASDEDNPTFECVDDLVVVAGATIRGDHFVAIAGCSSSCSFFNLSLGTGHDLRLEPR
jgi:hypothetical protein